MKALIVFFDKQKRVFFKFPLEANSMGEMLPALYLELYTNKIIEAQWRLASYFSIISQPGDGQPQLAEEQSTLKFISSCQHYDLTPSQINVALELRKGITYKEMSKNLQCSVSTVNTHLYNIYDKLRVKNRLAAVKKLELQMGVV
jgi:DNA-binding CsgD family transcriptional regulator